MRTTLTCLAASRQSFFLLAVILLFAACCFSQEKILPQEEIDVLKEINSKLKVGWNFSANPCSEERTWRWNISNEITRYLVCDNCNGTICHVRQILLKGQNLTGDVPEDFGNLTYLFEIDLSRNYLSGSIPTTAWASLPLRIITLGGNRLAGLIPDDIGKITTLETINLENNLLNGSLPATLGKLTNLTRLLLAANNFTGELPKELVNLKNLQDFRIDGNGISGKIPNFIGNLTNLKRFDMQGTSMEGPFPSTFHTLDNLEQLTVSDFKGIGDFPALPTTNMKILVLRNCSLSGPLPDYIGEMRKIRRLDLSFNNLTGGIPETYNSLSSLENLYLTNNRLNGSIPKWILTRGKFMDISFNTFTGLPAPDIYLGSQLNLVASYSPLESDSINTYLKRDLPCAEKAKNYNFFINCGGSSVNFGGVEYESDVLPGGTSTFFVSDSKKWAYSSTGEFLGDNNLPNILKISASNFANSELYSSARMCASSLRYFGLCLKKGSYTVNLSFAEIIFTNGANFSSLGRRLFDVSVQGKKVLKDFNIAEEANGAGRGITKSFIVDVEGSTLEIHLQWAGKGTNAIPIRGVYGPLISAISVTPNFKPDPMPFGAILGIIASSLILSVLIITFFWFYLRKNHRQNTELQGLDLPTGNFSLKQIKSGTRNFNPANKIGEGGFGPVYKCVLPDGGVVAVKQLSSKSRQGNREFVNEIGMISGLNHPNLVKLHGCCMEGNQLLLIYEYMEKNSLARALFGPEGMRLTLDWRTRYKICLGVANGLAYLHEESRLKIVHRDIKATNILLDKDLNAKISDFGLAKLDEEDNSHISTRIAGTVGYMAPEYAMKGYLTNKADVYSFGVVVLEVISGKSNGSFRPCEEFEYLLDWAHALKEENLLQVVDPILRGNYSKEEARLLLDLALQCTNQSADLRPIMSAVVRLLVGDPSMSRVNDMEEVALSSFEQLSHDYQGDASSYGPSMNSSVPATSSKDCSYHYSSGAPGISSYGPTSRSIPANDDKGNGTSVSQEARLLPTTE